MGIIIIGGLLRIAQGDRIGLNNFNNAFQAEDLAGLNFNQIGLAFYQGLLAYDGWANLNNMTEEVKDSKRTVPRAIIIALILVIILYLLVNVGYFSGNILSEAMFYFYAFIHFVQNHLALKGITQYRQINAEITQHTHLKTTEMLIKYLLYKNNGKIHQKIISVEINP